jgi:hypothetical protein
VVINGGAILQQLLSGPIGNIVESAINEAFKKQSRKKEGLMTSIYYDSPLGNTSASTSTSDFFACRNIIIL